MGKKPIPPTPAVWWRGKHPNEANSFDSVLRRIVPPGWPWRWPKTNGVIIDARRKPGSPTDPDARRERQRAKRARQSKERR